MEDSLLQSLNERSFSRPLSLLQTNVCRELCCVRLLGSSFTQEIKIQDFRRQEKKSIWYPIKLKCNLVFNDSPLLENFVFYSFGSTKELFASCLNCLIVQHTLSSLSYGRIQTFMNE